MTVQKIPLQLGDGGETLIVGARDDRDKVAYAEIAGHRVELTDRQLIDLSRTCLLLASPRR